MFLKPDELGQDYVIRLTSKRKLLYHNASQKDIYLVLVYGIIEHPMMLATNKEIKYKDDVIRVARTYFSRWKKMLISAFGTLHNTFRTVSRFL